LLDDVTVTSVHLHRVRLALREPLWSAHGVESHRDATLVRVERSDGVSGWGECAALSRPTYTAEYADSAYRLLRDRLAPALVAGAPLTVVGHPMARLALDGAVIDASLRAAGRSLASALGGTRTTVTSSAVVGRHDTVDELLDQVGRRVAEGYASVSLKIAPGWDREPLGAVRSAWPDLALAADANGAYGRDDRDVLAALDDLALTHLEQPLPADDLVGLAALARAVLTPIALDESIASLGDLDVARALGSGRVLNLKPARLGSFEQAATLAARAADEGWHVFCGGMLETGVGRAGALAVASLEACDRPTHLGPSDRYVETDVTPPIVLGPDATLAVPSGAGIGVTPDPARVAAAEVDHAVVAGG
jgi:O-succinylbenzoate synthase